MNKNALLSLVLGSALTGAAFAGAAPSGKAPKNPTPVVQEESSMLTGSVTLGYDSRYVFKGWEPLTTGGDKIDHLISGALDLNAALSDKLTLNFNAWYGGSADVHYTELDLYTKLSYNAGPFSIGPSFKWYHYPTYPGAIDNQYEVGLEIAASPVENLAVSAGAFYEFESEWWYFQVDANYTIKVTDWLSLVPGAQISVVDVDDADFALHESGFHHTQVYLRAPIKVSKDITLTPYIAGNFPLGDLEPLQDNLLFGGAALSWSF